MMATESQLPIDDALLGKFLAGEASLTETDRVRRWLTNPANQREFDRFSRIWTTAEALGRPASINTDAAWQRVRSKMNGAAESPANPVIRPLDSAGPKRSRWVVYSRMAAMLTLALLAGVSVWRLTRSTESLQQTPLLSAATTTTTRRLTLPDGSEVLLNRNSRLTYPATFADSSRDIALTGEAFFEVAHDARHPFRVRAGRAVVRVLGTSFNVRALGDSIQVAVRTGRVQLSTPRQAVVLMPNQQATYLDPVDTIRRTVPLDANRLAYQTGRLSFTNTSLAEVVQTLREVYGTTIRLDNPAVGRCRLTADFGAESIDVVLAVVSETLSLTIKREGDAYVLTGAGCGV
ncbi:FecR family protein [Spirosoma utsteinense]|uniref:Ferric-dicitrate binding protein FerR (Iron transport regulator) n=1 Tax=Spirosoma utsteinense TaxID=2585773 RepID=A0ABR6WA56_9BACT|nr:FecR domain-containing protein [Spirosoma utsteinense]MBC3784070.1 ferric-dicitrate binding protein FerR (iron transport regulator) [Spirosoma utsteinense]MBC3793440.1 ferric-dicitrate binding protein FerR (iron transport regulator) [Spirosoma utsteinense]